MRRHLHRLDHRLMERSFARRAPARDRRLVTITQAANYSRLWLVIAGAVAVFGGARGRRAASRGVVAVAAATLVSNGPAKLLVRRPRPFSDRHPTLIALPRSSSFPSGHSAAAFAFAFAASAELPVVAPILIPLAGRVAYSRVHTGVHYPSDVVVGAAIGIAAAAVAPRLTGCLRVGRRIGSRSPRMGDAA